MGSPVSNPRVNIQLLPAAIVDAFEDRRNLIVGQKGSGGTTVSGNLVLDIHLKTEAEIRTLFGQDELYWRIKSWRDAVNVRYGGRLPKLDVIAVNASGTGVAATAVHTFAGTATAVGEYTIAVVDEERFKVTVSVANGDTATVVAGKVVAALAAIDYKPFSVANLAGVVTYTADDLGTIGNTYGIKITGNVSGLTVATTGWTGGANDPTVTTIFDPIEARRYTGVSWPEWWNSQLSVATNEFDARFNASNNILDGIVFHGYSATVANAKALVGPLNSQSLVVIGNNKIDFDNQKGPAILQPADWVAAAFMGIRDKRLTPGAQIADVIVAVNAPRDATGGPELASLPYFNTPLFNTPVTTAANTYTYVEQLELEDDGFTTYGVNTAANNMLMGPVITTWTTDVAGNVNPSFHYLNYVDIGSVCREIIYRFMKAVFVQARLTLGDLIPGRSIENAGSIRAKLMEIYKFLADAALVQAGQEAEAFFSKNTTIDINLAQGLVSINGPLPIVTQLRTINYNLQLAFSLTNEIQITV